MRGTTLAQAEIKAYNTFLIDPPDVRAAWAAGHERGRSRHGKHAADLLPRDEFAFLLPEADRASAEQVAADIIHLVRDTATSLNGGTRARHATASIGVVLIEHTGMTASELVKIADLTMYGAKESGRDRYAMARHPQAWPKR